eukprot:TRINITY_DN33240_c0_g1_i1.p1 TRINITY_DN33240_c0_g1~~TRINITY_DN33240_c0_g1_i1.p1  ORF type:complete len:231 (+),score=22.05 TRINITY_DN33240_c0_g1_i1:128-820(+)
MAMQSEIPRSSHHKRSSASRREQYRRAEARRLLQVLRTLGAVSIHRGSQLGRFGGAVVASISSAVAPHPTCVPFPSFCMASSQLLAAERLPRFGQLTYQAEADECERILDSATLGECEDLVAPDSGTSYTDELDSSSRLIETTCDAEDDQDGASKPLGSSEVADIISDTVASMLTPIVNTSDDLGRQVHQYQGHIAQLSAQLATAQDQLVHLVPIMRALQVRIDELEAGR